MRGACSGTYSFMYLPSAAACAGFPNNRIALRGAQAQRPAGLLARQRDNRIHTSATQKRACQPGVTRCTRHAFRYFVSSHLSPDTIHSSQAHGRMTKWKMTCSRTPSTELESRRNQSEVSLSLLWQHCHAYIENESLRHWYFTSL